MFGVLKTHESKRTPATQAIAPQRAWWTTFEEGEDTRYRKPRHQELRRQGPYRSRRQG